MVSLKEEPADRQGSIVQTFGDPSNQKSPGFKDLWREKRILAWCIMIFLLPINFGYELALVGNIIAIPAFLRRYGRSTPTGAVEITAHDQQVLNASTTVGIFLAAFSAGFIADRFGRRAVVLSGCVLCIAGIFVQGFSQTIMVLFGGKLISTIGYGLGHALAPVYVAEIVPDNMRGICLTLVNTMIVVGQWSCALVSYGTSSIESDWAWRTPILTQLIPPTLMLLLATPLLPESPSWLIIHGESEKAAAALKKFNGPDYDSAKAVAVLQATIQKELAVQKEGASYIECFKGVNLRRTTIVCLVYIAQQFVGANFVAGYLPYYFTVAGVDNPVGIAQVSYAIQLLGNIVSLFLVDRVGRRPMIVYGTIAITSLLLLIGGLGTLDGNRKALQAVVAFMSLWGFLFQLTLGAVAYAVGGETPTARLRQKTYSINVMSNTAAACIVTQLVPILVNPGNANLGAKIAFVFFAPSVLLSIYLFFCFPELKGRSYLELEDMFQKRLPARQFKNYVCTVEVIATTEEGMGQKAVAIVHDEDVSKV